MISMDCDKCATASQLSKDLLNPDAKALHDQCQLTVQNNGQTELCDCPCNADTSLTGL